MVVLLNSNIRCIEMMITNYLMKLSTSWIVTLDVLKYAFCGYDINNNGCWIVTLDVLKCHSMQALRSPSLLNSNIRCIEIEH